MHSMYNTAQHGAHRVPWAHPCMYSMYNTALMHPSDPALHVSGAMKDTTTHTPQIWRHVSGALKHHGTHRFLCTSSHPMLQEAMKDMAMHKVTDNAHCRENTPPLQQKQVSTQRPHTLHVPGGNEEHTDEESAHDIVDVGGGGPALERQHLVG